MKTLIKVVSLLFFLTLLLFLIKNFLLSSSNVSDNDLYIYNWGEYIDEDLIEEFEVEYGYNVIYDVYDSNEAMLTKVKTNSSPYDLVFPSEYMVQKMKKEKLLVELDHSQIPNLKNISPDYLNPTFDLGNQYTIPYFWGTVGIIYNPTLTNLEFNDWNDLWDESLKDNILLVDGSREMIGVGLNSLNYSLNSTDENELKKAQEHLFDLEPNIKGIIGDEMLQTMPQKEAAAAITWSGSAADMISVNEDLIFKIPGPKTNIWIDCIVIPKTSKNTKGAYEFINFMLRPDISARNAEYVGYATPNDEGKKLLDHSITSNENFYPSKNQLKNLEYYKDLNEYYTQLYSDMFLEFKMNR